jgi:hypothetical protein
MKRPSLNLHRFTQNLLVHGRVELIEEPVSEFRVVDLVADVLNFLRP